MKRSEPRPDANLSLPGDDDDEVMVVCLRVAGNPALPGSTKRQCDRCGEAVWLSAATEEGAKQFAKKKFVCMECAQQNLDQDPRIHPPTPGQIAEMADYLWKQHAEKN
jgi:hypothetical protein